MTPRALLALLMVAAAAFGLRAGGQTEPGVLVCIHDGANDGGEVTRDVSVALREPRVVADANYDSAPNRVDGYPDECEALLQWDLTEEGESFVPVAAAITLEVTDPSTAPVYLYGVNREWSASEATWLFAGADGGAWTEPGALGSSEDVDSTAIAAFRAEEPGPVRIELNEHGLQLVEDWIQRRRPNAGVIVRELDLIDGLAFENSGAHDGGRSPTLELTREDGGVVVFQNSLVDSIQQDTSICDPAPENLDYHGLVVSGPKPGASVALLHFDTSSIPSEAIILDARLRLTGFGSEIEAHELLRPFDESSATWDQSAQGQPWELSGAEGSTDRAPAILGSYVPAEDIGALHFNDAGVNLVQRWVKHPADNRGLILTPSLENGWASFHDRSTSGLEKRPALCVRYLPDDAVELGTCGCSSSAGTSLLGLALIAWATRRRRARAA